jgi:hypothetical protein
MNLLNRVNFIKSLDLEGKVGIEIGVGNGVFSNEILANSKLKKLYSIDCWEYNQFNSDPIVSYNNTVRTLKPYGDRSQIIKAYANLAVDSFEDQSIDFIYIDGDHNYEPVKRDILLYYPKIKIGGILSGHDYSQNWPGVVQAVNEIFLDLNLDVQRINIGTPSDDGDPSWVVIKE